jgi:ATP-dependent protease ClpP protease subunit
MIKFILLTLLSFFSSSESSYNFTQNKVLDFNSRNLITIRGPIQGSSSTSWITAMNDRDPDVDTIYLYLSSPGGSVLEGNKLIDQIKTLQLNGVNVVCVADFAASMAFVILQSCPTRLALPSSILMQHQMSLGLKGSLENVDNYLDFIHSINDNLEKLQSDRMNMTEEDFRNKVMNDWWIPGHLAKKLNAVDDLVMVKCSKELIPKRERITVRTIFGTVEITYSKCPIAREPIDIKFNDRLNQEKPVDWELLENEIKDYIPSVYLKHVMSKKSKMFSNYPDFP